MDGTREALLWQQKTRNRIAGPSLPGGKAMGFVREFPSSMEYECRRASCELQALRTGPQAWIT